MKNKEIEENSLINNSNGIKKDINGNELNNSSQKNTYSPLIDLELEEKNSKKILKKKNIIIYVLSFLLFVASLYIFEVNYSYSDPLLKKHRSSLYEYFKYPQISLILPFFNDTNINTEIIIQYIQKIKNQKLKDIEVLLAFNKDNQKSNIENILNLTKNDSRFKIHFNLSQNIPEIDNILNLIFLSKGRIITISNVMDNITEDSLYLVWNKTLGKSEYIFDINNKTYVKKQYLISYYDEYINDISIYKSFNELLNEIKNNNNFLTLNYIPINYCSDNNYALLTYVSLISLLDNKNYNTFYIIYYLIDDNFSEKSKNITLSLYEQFDNFNITFIQMDNRYDEAFISRYISKTAFFRLSLPSLLPKINKIIYMDGDTIIYKDLSNLYIQNLGDKAMMGFLNIKTQIRKNNSFNSGILLMNLKQLRKINFEKKVYDLIKSGDYNIDLHDQGIINKILKDQIKIFGVEYNARPIENEFSLLYLHFQICWDYYNVFDYIFKNKNPYIRHYFGANKPYQLIFKIYNYLLFSGYINDWWYYALKGKYFNELLKLK